MGSCLVAHKTCCFALVVAHPCLVVCRIRSCPSHAGAGGARSRAISIRIFLNEPRHGDLLRHGEDASASWGALACLDCIPPSLKSQRSGQLTSVRSYVGVPTRLSECITRFRKYTLGP